MQQVIFITKNFQKNRGGSVNNKYQGSSHITAPIIFYFWIFLGNWQEKWK